MTGVYKITNPDGKIYIGAAIDFEERKRQYALPSSIKQGRRINKSIEHHGYSNHSFEILEECDPKELYRREYFWIKELNTVHPNGLNSSAGTPDNCRYKSIESAEDVKREIKAFRMPISLIKRLELAAQEDNRTLSGFLIHHLEETLPK